MSEPLATQFVRRDSGLAVTDSHRITIETQIRPVTAAAADETGDGAAAAKTADEDGGAEAPAGEVKAGTLLMWTLLWLGLAALVLAAMRCVPSLRSPLASTLRPTDQCRRGLDHTPPR